MSSYYRDLKACRYNYSRMRGRNTVTRFGVNMFNLIIQSFVHQIIDGMLMIVLPVFFFGRQIRPYILFNNREFFVRTLFARLLHRESWNLFICWIQMHNCIVAIKLFIPATFYGNTCTITWKWIVIFMCVRGINFTSLYDFSATWYFIYFFIMFISLLTQFQVWFG